jgi:quinol monooxygenase YgiN
MSEPFIYIGTHTIKRGRLEEAKKMLQELVELVETNEPRLIAFNVYLDEEGDKVAIVQVHPDAASMEFHMQVISTHLANAFDVLESTESEQLYGKPGEGMVESFQEYSPGTPITVFRVHEVGFTRTNAAR